jgi:hypothetical protein
MYASFSTNATATASAMGGVICMNVDDVIGTSASHEGWLAVICPQRIRDDTSRAPTKERRCFRAQLGLPRAQRLVWTYRMGCGVGPLWM